jgi:hypothetical protein
MISANYPRLRAVHANFAATYCACLSGAAGADTTALLDSGGASNAIWYAIPAAFLLGVLAALAIYSRLQSRRPVASRASTAEFSATAPADGVAAAAAATPQTNVFLLQQGANGERFEITHTPYRIGRATERNDITLKHPSISRRHAQITLRKDGVYEIMDMESLNGLFVNDRKVKSSPLADGDIIDIGDLTFRFTTRAQ